ncbi:hypothetical protein R3P38DRAFT_3197212 [Favolaschia claudopus]|uniref:Uncharacterized protein n=1 Tax=Favolaschia claudopus TaxID=2862362 RepID=A0AAW0B413_9AGAR
MTNYIEKEDGSIISGKEAQEIRATQLVIYRDIQRACPEDLPKTWGAASLAVITYHRAHMYAAHPILRLCSGHWKVERLATQTYSSWYSRNVAKKAKGVGQGICTCICTCSVASPDPVSDDDHDEDEDDDADDDRDDPTTHTASASVPSRSASAAPSSESASSSSSLPSSAPATRSTVEEPGCVSKPSCTSFGARNRCRRRLDG